MGLKNELWSSGVGLEKQIEMVWTYEENVRRQIGKKSIITNKKQQLCLSGRPPVTWEGKVEQCTMERLEDGVKGIKRTNTACEDQRSWGAGGLSVLATPS